MNRMTAMLLITSALTLSACASKAPKQLPPDPGSATTSGMEAQGPVPGSQADFVAYTRGQDTIYFETDRYNIDNEDAAALTTQAQWLLRYPGKREYNLALGERRANAAKSYLASLGVDAGRLATVSYGKERPAALGSDEASWARNRRAVTITID